MPVGAGWRPGVVGATLVRMGVTSGAGGEMTVWLPAQPSWTDATGTVLVIITGTGEVAAEYVMVAARRGAVPR